MGLYLAVFDGNDEELEGVEVGYYDDFNWFRKSVSSYLEKCRYGSRFPILQFHTDCDGEWSPEEAKKLENELLTIQEEMSKLQPIALNSEWQEEVSRVMGVEMNSLADCFFDVDGESLLERLICLARVCQQENCPIVFQ